MVILQDPLLSEQSRRYGADTHDHHTGEAYLGGCRLKGGGLQAKPYQGQAYAGAHGVRGGLQSCRDPLLCGGDVCQGENGKGRIADGDTDTIYEQQRHQEPDELVRFDTSHQQQQTKDQTHHCQQRHFRHLHTGE